MPGGRLGSTTHHLHHPIHPRTCMYSAREIGPPRICATTMARVSGRAASVCQLGAAGPCRRAARPPVDNVPINPAALPTKIFARR